MRGGLSQKQLAKQRLDLFPPKGRLGARPARASRGQGSSGQGGLEGARATAWAAQKVAERRPQGVLLTV